VAYEQLYTREDNTVLANEIRRYVATVIHMRNPDPFTKEKLAQTHGNMLSEYEFVKETKSRIHTKLDEIENHKDQLRNHWRAAREIVDGYTGHQAKETQSNQDEET
jgi:hypothetical protein